MPCPRENCKSEDVRVSEPGLFSDTMYCNTCCNSYESASSSTKKGAIAIGLTLLGAVLGVNLSQ